VRFLLDESFPRSVAAILLERGHETVDLRSVGLLGAIETSAVILTTDRDFFHSWIVLIPLMASRATLALKRGSCLRRCAFIFAAYLVSFEPVRHRRSIT
jgi:hypothetical protein